MLDNEKINIGNYYKFVIILEEITKKYQFKFYNLKIFDKDSDIILEEIVNIINNNGTSFENKDLIYDLKALTIEKNIVVEKNQCIVKMKYFDYNFELKLILENTFNDNDKAIIIQKIFKKPETLNKLIIFKWNKKTTIFEKINDFVIKTINSFPDQLFCNGNKIEIDEKNLDVFMFDLYPWNNQQEIQSGFEYGDSKTKIITIQTHEVIEHKDLENAINSQLKSGNIELLNQNEINYNNFWEKSPFEKWLQQIQDFFNKTPLIIKDQEIKIDVQNLSFDLNHKFTIDKFAKSVDLKIQYTEDSENFEFFIKVNLNETIDSSKFKEFIIKAFENKTLDAHNFKSLNKSQVINEINKQIRLILESQENNANLFELDKIQVKSYHFLFKVNKPEISIAINSEYLLNEEFKTSFFVKNSNQWILENLQNYFRKFNKNNPLDLKFTINEENTWQDIINFLKSEWINDEFDVSVFEKILWYTANGSLFEKLKHNNIDNNVSFKILKFKYQDLESQSITLNVKNIKIINYHSLDIEFVKNQFRHTYSTKHRLKAINWTKDQYVSSEDLGIDEPTELRDTIITYKTKTLVPEDGYMDVEVSIKKGDKSEEFLIAIFNFLAVDTIFEFIKEFFRHHFSYSVHKLSTKSKGRDVYNTIINFVKSFIGEQNMWLINISLVDDINNLIVHNNNDQNGAVFGFKVLIYKRSEEYEFIVDDVYDQVVLDIKLLFPNKFLTTRKYFYLGEWKVEENKTAKDLGIDEPIDKQGSTITYKIKSLNVNDGLMQVAVTISKSRTKTSFEIEIKGFKLTKPSIDDVVNFLELHNDESKPFSLNSVITKDNTWKEFFAHLENHINETYGVIKDYYLDFLPYWSLAGINQNDPMRWTNCCATKRNIDITIKHPRGFEIVHRENFWFEF